MPKRIEYGFDKFKNWFFRSVSGPLNSYSYKPTRPPIILKRKFLNLVPSTLNTPSQKQKNTPQPQPLLVSKKILSLSLSLKSLTLASLLLSSPVTELGFVVTPNPSLHITTDADLGLSPLSPL